MENQDHDGHNHICYIVPPHLLEAMAESNDPQFRALAQKTMGMGKRVHKHRRDYFAAKLEHGHGSSGGGGDHGGGRGQQSIVPNILLEHLSQAEGVDDAVKENAAKSLAMSQKMRTGTDPDTPAAQAGGQGSDTTENFTRGVYDMQNQGDPEDESSFDLLPGTPVRLEGQPATSDKNVNEAYDSAFKVLEFYKKTYDYISLDNKNMPVVSSVHFAKSFGNAFWFAEKSQMVYGDGDEFIGNFTSCIDVIGHEMTHAVTGFNSKLQYQGESGALNEHISDAFGIMVKQMVENEQALDADWLIGEGCLLPGVKGVSLRSMKAPGTAYNDPRFGTDIQPDNYKDIATVTKKYSATIQRDSGGVHIFSGIPNKAFYLCAVGFKGYTWEKAGQIWWKTVTTNKIAPNCTFIQFADVTVDVAADLYGDDAAKIVRDAWNKVGVVRKH